MDEERDRVPSFPGSGKAIVLPVLGAPVADTHAHLDMLEDPAGALVRAAIAGVGFVCSVVDLTEEPEYTLQGLPAWLGKAGRMLGAELAGTTKPPGVRLIVGVHPHNARLYDDAMHDALASLARQDDRVAGLGELGLDFHYDYSPRDAQRAAFRRQLGLAAELGLPVTVHLREAHEEGLSILAEEGVPERGCVIHCFTEGPELVERFLALSPAVMISFAGPVTFGKAEQIRDAAKVVPLGRLLVETDSPFLAPAPYRGEPNEPRFVVLTAARIADVLGLDPAEFASATTDNARSVFGAGAGGGAL